MTIDRASLLMEVAGDAPLDDVERAARAEGLTLDVDLARARGARGVDVATWIAKGLPGARSAFADPADHAVAGLEAKLRSGEKLVVHPGPRRAVGPDLAALVLGCGERFARVERAWLRLHVVGARRPSLPLPGADLDPPLDDGEVALLDAIAASLGR